MTSVLINNTELVALNAYAYQHPSGKRELRITIPQSATPYAYLKELLKAHDGDIVLNKDGKTETFVGYKTTASITDKVENDVEVFYVVLECVGEAERKAAEATQKVTELQEAITEQNKVISEQNAVIAFQTEELELLNEVLLEEILYGSSGDEFDEEIVEEEGGEIDED